MFIIDKALNGVFMSAVYIHFLTAFPTVVFYVVFLSPILIVLFYDCLQLGINQIFILFIHKYVRKL